MPGQLIDGIDPMAVTGGNAHDHDGGDGAAVPYATGLSGQPTLGTAAAADIGTGAGDVAAGDDSRLSDDRDPTAHASNHTDGTDDIQDATASAKGLMTAAYAAKLDAVGALTTDTTVNLTYDMTAAQIQALIDAQPLNLGGYTLTFQFGDGTYNSTMTARLTLPPFYAGTVVLQGNTGDTTPYEPGTTDPAVILDMSAGTTDCIYAFRVAARLLVQNLWIKTADASYAMALDLSGCSGQVVIKNVVLEAAGQVNVTIGIGAYSCNAVSVYTSFVSNQYLGISSQTSRLFSNGNDDYGTAPKYGLQAGSAGVVGKTGTQPAGGTNNELVESGGEIR